MRVIPLKKLLPGVIRPLKEDPSCGLKPNATACHLARLLYHREANDEILSFACGFGARNLDCFKARERFKELRKCR